ncbi:hypothetical protein JNK13_00810 [bacterium]|nr:hypothetical protein [bacterium]
MNNKKLIFLTLFVIPFVLACAKRPSPDTLNTGLYLENTTKLEFLDQLRGYKRTAIKEFPDPALGVGLTYKLEDAWFDVFIYPAPQGTPDGARSQQIAKHFKTAIKDVSNQWKNARIIPGKEIIKLGLSKQSPESRSAKFQITQQSGPKLYSQLYLTVFKGQFIKIRASVPFQNKNSLLMTTGFADAIAELISKASSASAVNPKQPVAKFPAKQATAGKNNKIFNQKTKAKATPASSKKGTRQPSAADKSKPEASIEPDDKALMKALEDALNDFDQRKQSQ